MLADFRAFCSNHDHRLEEFWEISRRLLDMGGTVIKENEEISEPAQNDALIGDII